MTIKTALACTMVILASLTGWCEESKAPERETARPKTAYSDYFLSLTFRESPYAPHRGIHRINAERAAGINHYRFDYDDDGRLLKITFGLGDQPRGRNHTANYFWYASGERYSYEGDAQRVNYIDEWGEPTTVDGEVAVSEYTLDAQGRRVELRYLDEDDIPVENSWGIARYAWSHLDDGSIIETRFDLEDKPAPLRPGFEFQRIRIAYGVHGYTRLMQNLDANGSRIGAVDGFAQDRFTHSPHGELIAYEVLDTHGNPGTNHQGISSGSSTFTPEGYEHTTAYFDANGRPAYNQNGWWRSSRSYDQFGNLTLNAFQDLDGNSRNNPNTGYATAVIEWHEDGLRRHSFSYFDETGAPTAHTTRGYQKVLYRYDPDNTPYETVLVNTDGELVERSDQGWAVTRYHHPLPNGRPVESRYSLEELRQQRLSDALAELHQLSKVPGMASAIAIDGQVQWQGQSGMADIAAGTPVTADTVFRLASVSKALTSILAAQAIESGALTLDTPASDLLPLDHPATLRQLLAHTGSVDHYRPGITVDLDRAYPSSQAALATVEPHLLERTPGTAYTYSTFGYTLAGAMLEAATGETFPEQVSQLASGAGAASLSAPIDESAVENLTRFYEIAIPDPEPARERNFSYGFPGAGIVANASDLARVASLFAAGVLTGDEQRDAMITPAMFNDGPVVTDRSYEVALGWRRQAGPQGRTWFHHAGVTDGARSIVAIEPTLGVAVVILSNASWTSDMFGTAVTLANLFLSPPSAGTESVPRAIEYEEEDHAVLFEACQGVSCTWRNAGSGELNSWLARGGRGLGFSLQASSGATYLASPYGLSWFEYDTARIGSRKVVLKH